MTTPKTERALRNSVMALIETYLATTDPATCFTPYRLARILDITTGSAASSVRALVRDDRVHQVGASPLMVSRKR